MGRTIKELKPTRVGNSDDRAVDNFAQAMKAKMRAARQKGRTGWNDPKRCRADVLAEMLIGHISKGNAGNFEDIANFCMMLHQRGDDPSVLAAALVEHDEKVHVRTWDNGYLNGREDTLSEVAQKESAVSKNAKNDANALRRTAGKFAQRFTDMRLAGKEGYFWSDSDVACLLVTEATEIERGEA